MLVRNLETFGLMKLKHDLVLEQMKPATLSSVAKLLKGFIKKL